MTIRAKRKTTRPDEYLSGIPNRDLTEEEYQSLNPEDRKRVRASDLYDVKADDETAPRRVVANATPGKDG